MNNNDNLHMSATNEISSSQLVGQQFVNHKIPKQHLAPKNMNKIVHFEKKHREINNPTLDPKNYIS
jgi:hypothetical protein